MAVYPAATREGLFLDATKVPRYTADGPSVAPDPAAADVVNFSVRTARVCSIDLQEDYKGSLLMANIRRYEAESFSAASRPLY